MEIPVSSSSAMREDLEENNRSAGDVNSNRPKKSGNPMQILRKGFSLLLEDKRVATTVLVNLAGMMERMDEQLLPSVYSYVAASWNASPEQLGNIAFGRAVVQAFSSPIGGLLGYYYNRIHVMTAGCVLWGLMTASFGLCQNLTQGFLVWSVNGLGLALVIPTSQSLVADFYTADNRGKAFGVLYFTGALGGMLASLFGTNVGEASPLGIEGWRLAFFTVAVISIAIGLLNLFLSGDPRASQKGVIKVPPTAGREVAKEVLGVMQIPTFVIIILQGILGSMPWNAMVFLTLYLQLIGMSNVAASGLMSTFLAATAFGGVLGGWIGDIAGAKYPRHGRIFVCQFSVFIGIPFTLLIIKGLPTNGEPATVALYGVAFAAMGLLKSWPSTACNNPVFAEIVPQHLRNVVYAFDRCFEMAIAACAAPLVGRAAEHMFGFVGSASRSGDPAIDLPRAEALGSALVLFMVGPWASCFIIYTGLHFTYPRDKLRAQQALENKGQSDEEWPEKSESDSEEGFQLSAQSHEEWPEKNESDFEEGDSDWLIAQKGRKGHTRSKKEREESY